MAVKKVKFKVLNTGLTLEQIDKAQKTVTSYKNSDTICLKSTRNGTAVRASPNLTNFDGWLITTTDCADDEKIIIEITSNYKTYAFGLEYKNIKNSTMELSFKSIQGFNDYKNLC